MPEPPDRDALLAGVHVVLVGADAETRELLAVVLEYAGARVTVAGTAREALATLRRVRPRVLVSTVALPGEDGCWLLRRVRRRRSTAALPALALSGPDRPEDRRRALAAGFDGHLQQPVDPWELGGAIAALLRR